MATNEGGDGMVKMTEVEWLTCESFGKLLHFLRYKVSDRKFRLLSAACGRNVWARVSCEHCRAAIEVTERYADEAATDAEHREAYLRAGQTLLHGNLDGYNGAAADTADDHAFTSAYVWATKEVHLYPHVTQHEVRDRLHLLRDIFGNPFRPVTLDPAWLSWHDGTIPQLAQSIYDERAFERLPILADALEEAGCGDAAILEHCRGPGPHVRGCWVVDLLTGRA